MEHIAAFVIPLLIGFILFMILRHKHKWGPWIKIWYSLDGRREETWQERTCDTCAKIEQKDE